MALSRNEKQAVMTEVSAKLARAQTVVLAEYRGVKVENLTQLRAKARQQGVSLHVLKNTLARRAIQGTQFSGLIDYMVGPLIYGFSEDVLAAAKVLSEFSKNNDKLILKAGSYDGQVLDKTSLQAFANIPSREVLLARLAGVMQAPVAGFARALAALAEKRQAEAV